MLSPICFCLAMTFPFFSGILITVLCDLGPMMFMCQWAFLGAFGSSLEVFSIHSHFGLVSTRAFMVTFFFFLAFWARYHVKSRLASWI